ncbi:MAG: tyrosine-type recombinase/integrase [Prochloraceae cyanobacterium]|nr:tyrosine-type recombinase/integrase [Prochloraceae cyanobacterium]
MEIIKTVLERNRPLTPEEKDLAKDKKYGKTIEKLGLAIANQEEYQEQCTGNGHLILNAIDWQLNQGANFKSDAVNKEANKDSIGLWTTLQLNCIKQDSDGDWWIECSRSKVYKNDRLFISKELAIKIQEQQKFIRDNFQNNFNYLFCTTEGNSWFAKYPTKREYRKKREIDHFVPIAQPIFQAVVRGYLHQLAHEHNIIDISGGIYPIWKCHLFRHTHLTDLARKGTGIAHIMQRAGHASPEMAMGYVHLTNDDQKKKMKEVWDNAHFNMEGEIVAPVNPDLDTAEMQWIKKGMGMQTTDNGYCTLLWTQTCPHQDLPCKNCGSWVTTLDFLDSHKKELKETEKIIENARQKGYQRQIEKNLPRAERLKKIISGMEKHQTMRGLGNNEWEEKR